MGRLFDAVASLIGLRDAIRHEGQAAMELEWRADGETSDRTYPFDVAGGDVWVVDSRPLIAAVVDDVRRRESIATIAARFHGTIARMTADVCRRIRETTGIGDVVLSGGVFLNARLTTLTEARLREAGFVVYRHRIVPPGDGGLCLGQLAIAAATTDAASP
jgi:hydrogenase maturation protein HypF